MAHCGGCVGFLCARYRYGWVTGVVYDGHCWVLLGADKFADVDTK